MIVLLSKLYAMTSVTICCQTKIFNTFFKLSFKTLYYENKFCETIWDATTANIEGVIKDDK